MNDKGAKQTGEKLTAGMIGAAIGAAAGATAVLLSDKKKRQQAGAVINDLHQKATDKAQQMQQKAQQMQNKASQLVEDEKKVLHKAITEEQKVAQNKKE